MKLIAKLVVGFCALMAGVAILFAVLLTPVVWLDGRAKSEYLRQTQGLEIPWYQAAWLNVDINSVNLKVDQR